MRCLLSCVRAPASYLHATKWNSVVFFGCLCFRVCWCDGFSAWFSVRSVGVPWRRAAAVKAWRNSIISDSTARHHGGDESVDVRVAFLPLSSSPQRAKELMLYLLHWIPKSAFCCAHKHAEWFWSALFEGVEVLRWLGSQTWFDVIEC